MKNRCVGECAKVSGLNAPSHPGRERSAWHAHLAWEGPGGPGHLQTCQLPAKQPRQGPLGCPAVPPLCLCGVREYDCRCLGCSWATTLSLSLSQHSDTPVVRTYTWALGRGSRWGNLRQDSRVQTGKQMWGPGDPGEHTEFSQEGQRSPVTARKPHYPSVMPTLPGPKEPDPSFGLEA